MKEEARSLRQDHIEAAAYKMLEQKGYAGTSMQGMAKQARASNETLYRWYGDKQGLLKALVTRNAAEVKTLLEAELSAARDPLTILGLLGPNLLQLLLGDRAVALNRAAVAGGSGNRPSAARTGDGSRPAKRTAFFRRNDCRGRSVPRPLDW